MNIQNGDENYKENRLYSLIMLPGLPVLLHFKNEKDLMKRCQTLLKTIPFKIQESDDSSIYNIKDKVYKQHRIDLEFDLLNGDRYIDKTDDNKYHIRNSFYDEEIPREIILGQAPIFTNEGKVKSGIEPPIQPGWNGETQDEIRKKHMTWFLSQMNESQSNGLELIIDGSDQGTGKNHSFAKSILLWKKQCKKISILMVCPRKDTIIETIKSICSFLSIPFPNLTPEGSLDETEINGDGIKIRLIQSDFGHQEVFNNNGWIEQKMKYFGKSATKRLNEIIKTPNDCIELNFITAQTLPYYFRQINQNNQFIYYERIFNRFDLLVFDELTNSPPLVRETFIDLMVGYQKIKDKLTNQYSRILILDASITSPDLFLTQIRPFFEDNEKFIPFQELIRDYKENPIEKKDNIAGISINYIRYQMNQTLIFGISSIGWDSFQEMPFDLIKQAVQQQIALVQQKNWSDFPNLDTSLTNGKVLFFIDNKNLIEECYDWLDENEYPCGISIAEQKDREFYDTKNILGTNSLAFGTNFPDKNHMIIIPPMPGSDHFEFRTNIELIRQVIKRMRGKETNIPRMIS